MIHSTIPGAFRLVTLGCKANQYDSQVLREALLRHGWRETDEAAQLVLLNTCTVTGEAGRKARQLVRRFRRENPEVRIAVTGCLAESEPERLRELPGVEWVFGTGTEQDPTRFLEELGHAPGPAELGVPPGITEFAGHTRAFLKIQDGCNMRCAFCIIPSVRGASRSRAADELAAEVRRLLANGHREIVLCGIHIGHWGRDLGLRLGDLLARLVTVEVDDPRRGGTIDWRLRLSSIEATEVDDHVLGLLADHPHRIAPHLHMPLQAGDDGVLRAMRRWYRVEEYLACCHRIRAALDRPAFSADVIVGFPGEDEAAFQGTLDAVRAADLARVHAFPFSPRPGTPAGADDFPARPADPAALRDRRDRLRVLADELAAAYRRRLVGTRDTVVLQGDGVGLSGRYQRVHVPAAPAPRGREELLEVQLDLAPDDDGRAALVGHPVAPRP